MGKITNKYLAIFFFLTMFLWGTGFFQGLASVSAEASPEGLDVEQTSKVIVTETVTEVPLVVASPVPWCSALWGMLSSTLHRDNIVIDAHADQVIDLSDTDVISGWYHTGDNASCYARFEPSTGQFNFDQSNYLNIDWCLGLKQGITDSTGSSVGDLNYSPIFDLNDDGTINLTDTVLMARLVAADDQAACYLHYVPPMPSWEFCGNNIVEGDEECDAGPNGSETCSTECTIIDIPQAICGNGIVEVNEVCDDGDTSTEMCGDNEVNNGTYCNATCTEAITLSEACDAGPSGSSACTNQCMLNEAPQPGPSGGGGGGGGGILPISIFNVQVTVGTSTANITWDTSRSSLTWMIYGLDDTYGQEYVNDTYNATHTVSLTNLLPNTTYHYQLRAKDSNYNTNYDIDRIFTTNALGGLPPQILGIKELACVPKIDADIKGVKTFANGRLIRGCGPEVYYIFQGMKFHIPSWQALHDNFFAKRIYNVSQEVVDSYQDFTGVIKGLKISQ